MPTFSDRACEIRDYVGPLDLEVGDVAVVQVDREALEPAVRVALDDEGHVVAQDLGRVYGLDAFVGRDLKYPLPRSVIDEVYHLRDEALIIVLHAHQHGILPLRNIQPVSLGRYLTNKYGEKDRISP